MTKLKTKKGTSLIVVFIICTVIGILLATTFFVTRNYGVSVISRKKQLRSEVCPTCVQEELPETPGEETPGENTNPEETQTGETTPETPEEGSVE